MSSQNSEQGALKECDEAFVKLVTILQTSAYSAGASGGNAGLDEMASSRAAIIDCYGRQEQRVAELERHLNKAEVERAWALGAFKDTIGKQEGAMSDKTGT